MWTWNCSRFSCALVGVGNAGEPARRVQVPCDLLADLHHLRVLLRDGVSVHQHGPAVLQAQVRPRPGHLLVPRPRLAQQLDGLHPLRCASPSPSPSRLTGLATLNAHNSIIRVDAAIMSPIAGLAVDRVGRNVYWILGATFLTGVSHAIMAYTFTIPLVATIIMGISYSSASPLIPMSPAATFEKQNRIKKSWVLLLFCKSYDLFTSSNLLFASRMTYLRVTTCATPCAD